MSFRHPLSEKWTEVELKSDTVRGLKYQTTVYMKALKIMCYPDHEWIVEHSGPLFGESYRKTYHFSNGGHPRTTTAYLEIYEPC